MPSGMEKERERFFWDFGSFQRTFYLSVRGSHFHFYLGILVGLFKNVKN